MWKAQIAGKYVGLPVEVPAFQFGVDNKTPQFAEKNPLQKIPVLETPEGCVFESNAIARYFARQPGSKIYGSSPFEAALIDQWIDFAANEIELPASAWLYPIFEIVPYNEEVLITSIHYNSFGTKLTLFLKGHQESQGRCQEGSWYLEQAPHLQDFPRRREHFFGWHCPDI